MEDSGCAAGCSVQMSARRCPEGVHDRQSKSLQKRVLPESEKRDRYTVAEIIELTKGQYGHEAFKAFFGK